MRPWAPEVCRSRLRAPLGSSWTGRERAGGGLGAMGGGAQSIQGGTELGHREVPALEGCGQGSGLC